MHTMKCKNCNGIVRKNFCSTCGQSTRVGKITFKSISQDAFQGIFYIKNGFLFTVRELFLRPGETIQNYLDGQRKRYFKPMVYVIVLSSLYYISVHLAGKTTLFETLISGLIENSESIINIDINDDKVKVPGILIWFSKNHAYFTLLTIPLFALASFISFLGLKVNYLEHIVLNLYCTAQQTLIYACFILINTVFKSEILDYMPSIFGGLYLFFVYWKFFKNGNRFFNVLRTLTACIISISISAFAFVGILIISHLN